MSDDPSSLRSALTARSAAPSTEAPERAAAAALGDIVAPADPEGAAKPGGLVSAASQSSQDDPQEPPLDAVAAYRRVVGASAKVAGETGAPARPELWTYPTFDASLEDMAEDMAGEAALAAIQTPARPKHKKKSRKHKMHIAHQTAGRVRMKISGAKGDEDLLNDVAATFRSIPGIRQVSVNAVTGSIVLAYDERCEASMNDHLMRRMESHGSEIFGSEFDALARKIENEAEFLAERSETARAVVHFMKRFDREIKRYSHNTVDLKILLAMSLIGLTVVEIGAHAATPVWLTLSVFTFNHFLELHTPPSAVSVAARPRPRSAG